MRAMCSPLPLLVLLIRADHAHDAAPAHDLALVTNPFDRCPDLHSPATFMSPGRLAHLPDNPRAPRVARRERHHDPIPGHQPDEIPARAARRMRDDLMPAIDDHPVERP